MLKKNKRKHGHTTYNIDTIIIIISLNRHDNAHENELEWVRVDGVFKMIMEGKKAGNRSEERPRMRMLDVFRQVSRTDRGRKNVNEKSIERNGC